MLKLVVFAVVFIIVLGILSIAVYLNCGSYEEREDDEWTTIAF